LNSSPVKCGAVPVPGEARVSLPGFALASATSSRTDFAGDEFGTNMKNGKLVRCAIGAKSAIGSYPSER
jgi:hypothetical protein